MTQREDILRIFPERMRPRWKKTAGFAQQLQEIRQEQAEKKTGKSKQQEHQNPTPGRSKQKKKEKQKGR